MTLLRATIPEKRRLNNKGSETVNSPGLFRLTPHHLTNNTNRTMKKYIGFMLALLAVPAFSQDSDAAKKPEGDRQARMEARRAEMVKKYDKDGDGKLSDEEREAMKKDRRERMEQRRAEMLKQYDKDGDGKLSDEERKPMIEARKKAREEREAQKAA